MIDIEDFNNDCDRPSSGYRLAEKILDNEGEWNDVHQIRGQAESCGVCGEAKEFHACCPQCGVTTNGLAEMEMLFGFRRMDDDDPKVIPQSNCHECR